MPITRTHPLGYLADVHRVPGDLTDGLHDVLDRGSCPGSHVENLQSGVTLRRGHQAGGGVSDEDQIALGPQVPEFDGLSRAQRLHYLRQHMRIGLPGPVGVEQAGHHRAQPGPVGMEPAHDLLAHPLRNAIDLVGPGRRRLGPRLVAEPVDRAAGGEHERRERCAAHRPDHRVQAENVDVQSLLGMGVAVGDEVQRRHVEDGVRGEVLDRAEVLGAPDVTLDHGQAAGRAFAAQVFALTHPEVIYDQHVGTGIQERVHKVGADEAGPACDKNTIHLSWPFVCLACCPAK